MIDTVSKAKLEIGIVGTGAVASALTQALGGESARCTLRVWGRRFTAAQEIALGSGGASAVQNLEQLSGVDAIVLAVSDGAIGPASALVAAALKEPTRLLHTSGASRGTSAMDSEAASCCERGSMHPLVAVARSATATVFQGMPFIVEGETEGVARVARDLVERMGGDCVALPATDDPMLKARYHALATMVASGVVALVDTASKAMGECGADQDAFRSAYAKLAMSAALNVERADGAEVLTGAVARRDEDLIETHRASLDGTGAADDYAAIIQMARRMLQDAEPDSPK